MKKILFPAIAAALLMTACQSQSNAGAAAPQQAQTTTVKTEVSDLAYIQVEAVLAQSDLYLKEGAPLQEKTQKTQQSWAQREQNLQAEAAQLQEKYQKGLMTTLDAQNKQKSLEQRMAALQNRVQTEGKTLEEENMVFTNRAQDLLARAVREINADKRYKMIFNASVLIDADSLLDLTNVVLQKVNELYAKDKAAEK